MSAIAHPTLHYSRQQNEKKRDYYISELLDRSADLDQCIDYSKDWVNDSKIYKYNIADSSGWTFDSQDGNFIGGTGIEDSSDSEFLSIELVPGSITDESGKWFTSMRNPNIPECSEVTFRVKMNSENLIGVGAAISIKAFHAQVGIYGAWSEEYAFLTNTENPVTGKLEGYVEELTIPCFSRKTTSLALFLRLMEATQGEVVFTDIEMEVKQ